MDNSLRLESIVNSTSTRGLKSIHLFGPFLGGPNHEISIMVSRVSNHSNPLSITKGPNQEISIMVSSVSNHSNPLSTTLMESLFN